MPDARRMDRGLLAGLLLNLPLLLVCAAPGMAVAAPIECSKAGNFVEKTICSDQELLRLDRHLDEYYTALTASTPVSSAALRREQRQWLRMMRDPCTNAVCLRSAYQYRIANLSLRFPSTPPMDDKLSAAGIVLSNKPAVPDSTYEAKSAGSHRGGRWYFEVMVDSRLLPDQTEASLVIGVVRAGGTSVSGSVFNIRPTNLAVRAPDGSGILIVGGRSLDSALSVSVIGIAADLDLGKVYVSTNGDWEGGPPQPRWEGSKTVGKDESEYQAAVLSSRDIRPLIESGALKVNFGSDAFSMPVPDGFKTYDPRLAAPLPDKSPFLPPFSRPMGASTEHWIQGYWRWTRGFPDANQPHRDATGELCAKGQTDQVWYLTGTNDGSPVRRHCAVPAGTYILVPIINTLTLENSANCKRLQAALWTGAGHATDLRLSLDGIELPQPDAYHANSGCFGINHLAPGSGTYLAVGDGYWVFLEPLAVGRHELRFGGRILRDGFIQDVTYVLDVK